MKTALLQTTRRLALAALAALPLLLAGCAALAPENEPKVDVVGVEPLLGKGPELRLLVKLRVVNPSNTAVDYDGVYVEINVDGQSYASGVSDAQGSVPRFSETLLNVPVTVNTMAVVRQVFSMAAGGRSTPSAISCAASSRAPSSTATASNPAASCSRRPTRAAHPAAERPGSPIPLEWRH
jgi:LEA14-like dessication related protein